MKSPTVFILSPARCDGQRAKVLLSERATFALATQLRAPDGAPIGEVFSFLSGLYFRGKLTYANAFARASSPIPPALIVTTDRGLVLPAERVRRDDLVAFASVDLAVPDERYRAPLRRDAESLAGLLPARASVVLLGSIATGKYVDILLDVLGARLLFPGEFVGRGDMSRGGLLLRAARAGQELEYVPVAGAVRHGKRPPKLERKR